MVFVDWLLGFIGFIGVILIAVISYFLKRLHFRIEEALKESTKQNEKTMEHLHNIDVKIASFSDIFREKIIEAVNILCKERQAACCRVQEEKINSLKNKHDFLCTSVEELKKEREIAWGEQRKLNERMDKGMNFISDKFS